MTNAERLAMMKASCSELVGGFSTTSTATFKWAITRLEAYDAALAEMQSLFDSKMPQSGGDYTKYWTGYYDASVAHFAILTKHLGGHDDAA